MKLGRVFLLLGPFIVGAVFIPYSLYSRCAEACGSSNGTVACLAHRTLRSSFVISLLSGFLLALQTRLLHHSTRFAVLFFFLHLALCNVIVCVFVSCTMMCGSEPLSEQFENVLKIGSVVLTSVYLIHSAVIVQGKYINSFLYRLIFPVVYSVLTTSGALLFLFSPWISAASNPIWGRGLLSIVVVCTLFGVKASCSTPRPLHEWELLNVPWKKLSALASKNVDEGSTAPFDIPRSTLGHAADQGKGTKDKTASTTGTASLSLRIVQLTDVHIGTYLTPEGLRQVCENVVQLDPDFVFLTGDFLTAEVHRDPKTLILGLSPLKKLPGRCFACYGNHDLEAPRVTQMVDAALESCGVVLLSDESLVVETPHTNIPVEIIGLHYYRDPRTRKEKFGEFFNHQRPSSLSDIFRFVLLHDPSGFLDVPPNLNAFVLSGHTHGGMMGFYSFGWTHGTLARFVGLYDNGLWIGNGNVLYVHRGQGSRSLLSQAITRLGVPSEESLLRIQLN